MSILNNSNNKIIAKNFEIYKSMWKKAKGLMFSKPRPLIMVFKKQSKIMLHMLFVFWPIDILFLDKSKLVVDLKEKAKPFQLSIKSKKPAKYVIELPFGTIKKTKTKIGHKITF